MNQSILILTDDDRADVKLKRLCEERLRREGARDILRRSKAGRRGERRPVVTVMP